MVSVPENLASVPAPAHPLESTSSRNLNLAHRSNSGVKDRDGQNDLEGHLMLNVPSKCVSRCTVGRTKKKRVQRTGRGT